MSNLQLFTEPGGDGGGSEGGDGAGAGGNPGNNNNTTMSFDEFLALEGNQSEFDRRVQKAVNTAVTNAQTKWKTLTDDKVSEAEKLAQMTNEEITADIISLIRRYAIGSALISHEARIRKAVDKLKKAHNFSKQELNWIARMEKYLMEESVLNVTVFDEDG